MGARYVHPGEPLSIDANVYNAAVDLYQQKIGRKPRADFRPESQQLTRIVCQNTTGQDLDAFSVVGLGDPITPPDVVTDWGNDLDDSEQAFTSVIGLSIVTILDGEIYRFGITQEAIPDGEFGELLISGVTPVRIKVPSGTDRVDYAVPNGTFEALKPTDCGICRVLWCPTDTGMQWAYVNIG